MQKTKRIFTAILTLMLVLSVPVFAASPGGSEIMPLWDNMSEASVQIVFEGTAGVAAAGITPFFGSTTLLDGTLTLYKQVGTEWEYIHHEYKLATSSLDIEFEFVGEVGVTYKAVFEIVAYGSSAPEHETLENYNTCRG